MVSANKPAVKSLVILAGSYTANLTTLLFTPRGSSSTLSLVGLSSAGTYANPSWIAQHPKNRSILFATNELEPGFITSYSVNSKGLVTAIDQQASNGTDPANLLPLAGEVIEPNYTSGSVQSHILAADGAHFASYGNEIQLVGSGPNPRQAAAHPHEAYPYGNEVLMPDLGSDKIWRLGREIGKKVGHWQINGYIQQPAGSGPRHIQVVGNTLYAIHELANTVTKQIIPAKPGNDFPTVLANVSTLPKTVPANSTFTAAELLISPLSTWRENVECRYLYASNRNIATLSSELDPRGDTIAIFATSPSLHVVKQVYTGLQQIRGMQISADGKYIVAAGLTGGGIAVFEAVDGGADLQLRARYTGSGSTQVSSFVWL